MRSLKIIPRESLSELNGITIDGKWHDAGRVKDFRSCKEMLDYLPDDVSLSWVSLKDAKSLESHSHPIESCVAILENEAIFVSTKDTKNMEIGHVVRIPATLRHSFSQTDSNQIFWGLAWNRTAGHLFKENCGERLVYFENELAESTSENICIIDVFKSQYIKDFFRQSPLSLSGEVIPPNKKITYPADGRSWIIIPQSGFFEISSETKLNAGDFVSNLNDDLIIQNTSDRSLYIFKLWMN